MVTFSSRITDKMGKHPFQQAFTAFAALDKEGAERLMPGHIVCHPPA